MEKLLSLLPEAHQNNSALHCLMKNNCSVGEFVDIVYKSSCHTRDEFVQHIYNTLKHLPHGKYYKGSLCQIESVEITSFGKSHVICLLPPHDPFGAAWRDAITMALEA